ncbi:hypothetical protein AAHA92_22761 [Salvia divinorum]|uniref:Uncharacterized protein n=1 Tax=Salvia divinorum TaxID=28513 RepID=A0ABD1GSR5_SALDI
MQCLWFCSWSDFDRSVSDSGHDGGSSMVKLIVFSECRSPLSCRASRICFNVFKSLDDSSIPRSFNQFSHSSAYNLSDLKTGVSRRRQFQRADRRRNHFYLRRIANGRDLRTLSRWMQIFRASAWFSALEWLQPHEDANLRSRSYNPFVSPMLLQPLLVLMPADIWTNFSKLFPLCKLWAFPLTFSEVDLEFHFGMY